LDYDFTRRPETFSFEEYIRLTDDIRRLMEADSTPPDSSAS